MATVVTTNLRAAQKRVNYTRLKSPAPVAVGSTNITATGPNTFNINSIVFQSGTTYRVTTSATHSFVVGESVTIAGTTNFNRAYTITATPGAATFDISHINGTDANGGVAGTATVTKVRNSTVAIVGETVTVTSNGHGFANGASVTIANAAQSTLNGAKTVANTAANTWEFTVAGIDTPAELLAIIQTALVSDVSKVTTVSRIASTTTYEVTTQKAHTNVVGDSVTIAGTTNFNGAKTVTAVPTPFTWRFTHGNNTDAAEAPVSGTATFTAASVHDAATGNSNETVFLVTKAGVTASAGYQEVDFNGSVVANQPTGLVAGTTYTCTVAVDGANNSVSFLGSAATLFSDLITAINADLTGATAAIVNGNIRITSAATGFASTIAISADNLFKHLLVISSGPNRIKPAVRGAGAARYVKVNTNTPGKILVNVYQDWNAGTNVGSGEIVAQRQTVNLPGATTGFFITADRSSNLNRTVVIS